MKNIKILTQTVLPKSIHNINPRTIMGTVAWNKIKKEKQKLANHHCMCCDEFVPHVPGNYLQCHEVYDIDMGKRQFRLVDIVCICGKCHDFIHLGRLQMLLKEGKISREYYGEILERGNKLLKENGLKRENLPLAEINNPSWCLVYNGKTYSNNE